MVSYGLLDPMSTHIEHDHSPTPEEIFRAWNHLEEALNELVDLGEGPTLAASIGHQTVRGDHGHVFRSEHTGRWIRGGGAKSVDVIS